MSSLRCGSALVAALTLTTSGLAVAAVGTAHANPAGTGLVVSEAYGGGGNSGATYTHDFVELFNPTGADISVEGWSVQYRNASGSAAPQATPLTGSVPAGGHYLVQEAEGAGGSTPLPAPDATGSIAMSGTGGQVWLATTTAVVTPPAGNVSQADIVDFVGAKTAATSYETAAVAANPSNTTAVTRDDVGEDTDDNSADFSVAAPTPANSTGAEPEPPTVEDATIAEVQGTGSQSPYASMPDTYVRTRGVVTAAYPDGGFSAFVIQTEGTATATDATPGASDGLWVKQAGGTVDVAIGEFVEVTGPVTESFGLTQLNYDAADEYAGLDALAEPFDPVTPLAGSYPTTVEDREAHESELLDVSEQKFTVTDTFATNEYAEIGLATGDRPLIQPTEVVDAQDDAARQAVAADNFARGVVLDDGADLNFLDVDANRDLPLPWLSLANPVRVGAVATVDAPVVLHFSFGDWRFQPTTQVTDEGRGVARFENTRPANAVPQPVGGDLTLATFNVLNYFNTTGVAYDAANPATCTYFEDRDDDPVTVDDCGATGPRGAAEDEDLQRQQAKIIDAINTMDADIVSLEEIENSVALGEADRDDALSALVDALNAAAGGTRWAHAPSPPASELPPVAEQDVIRTAFVYNPGEVELVGESTVLVGSDSFGNAREPLAQAFKALGAPDTDAFGAIVNHFKSKGSGTPDPDGQGNANADRVAQAEDLVDFAEDFKAERAIDELYLTGDFNSYTMEDPIQVLNAAGYTNLDSDTEDEWSYSFAGLSGSLDHVLANEAALPDVTGVDIWSINSGESVAFEYSRHNYNVTDFYQPDHYRASDHDPEVVGIDVPAVPAVATIEATAAPMRYGSRGRVDVTVTGDDPTGSVELRDGDTLLDRKRLDADGTATLFVPGKALEPGRHTLTVSYLGDADNNPATDTVDVRVRRA